MKTTVGKNATVIMIVAALSVSGCATMPGSQQAEGPSECNAVAIGAVGAVVGALIGGGTNRVRGAAIGAAIGALACVAINSQSRQTKTADAVDGEYRRTQGSLPAKPSVVRYTTSVQPAQAIRAGSDVQLNSNIEVVSGRQLTVNEIKEELVLLDPEGKEFRRATKVVNEQGGAGQYQNSFKFKLPNGAPQGVYTARTALYVNNQVLKQSDSKIQLVFSSESMLTVIASR